MTSPGKLGVGHHEAPLVIIGGGPTGLGAAWALSQSECDEWVLYEREDGVGGLARSFVDERGFTWDIGGHVVFSHYGAFSRLLDELLSGADWMQHSRESWIRILERWVPYPFQNNLHRLPPQQCAQCLEALVRAAISRPTPPFANFDDLIIRVFGEGIADLFMRPYNRKVWACDPKEMNATWTGDRVAAPDAARVARNVALREDDVSWGPNNLFRFPRKGGTGAIWQALAARLPQERVHLRHEAVEIDTQAKSVRFATGETVRYGTLISTIPLDRLAAIAGRKDWALLAAGLRHSAVHAVGVGLNGRPPEDVKTKCWMYFPEDNTPFYRVTHFSHYSPHNVDDIERHWSLMAEISESPQKLVDASRVVDDTIRGLVAAGLIEGADQVTHTWTMRAEYAYPTPSLERDGIVARLEPAMREAGILSRGRFGAWLYEVGNMDHCFMQGVETAGHLLHGSPELTLWRPHLVNTPHPVLGWDLYR